jgi:hypothetical protein
METASVESAATSVESSPTMKASATEASAAVESARTDTPSIARAVGDAAAIVGRKSRVTATPCY